MPSLECSEKSVKICLKNNGKLWRRERETKEEILAIIQFDDDKKLAFIYKQWALICNSQEIIDRLVEKTIIEELKKSF